MDGYETYSFLNMRGGSECLAKRDLAPPDSQLDVTIEGTMGSQEHGEDLRGKKLSFSPGKLSFRLDQLIVL